MFDNLIISTDKLPVSDSEKKIIGNDPNWQTKSLDCDLTEVYITDDGELLINRWEYENVPKEDRPHPDDDGLLGMFGSLKRVNQRLEKIQDDIDVEFYSNINDEWYEFIAKFVNGDLISINGGIFRDDAYRQKLLKERKEKINKLNINGYN